MSWTILSLDFSNTLSWIVGGSDSTVGKALRILQESTHPHALGSLLDHYFYKLEVPSQQPEENDHSL